MNVDFNAYISLSHPHPTHTHARTHTRTHTLSVATIVQELISAMTYSKAPEFVRMVQLILGNAAFDRALHRYHTKFAYSNARTSDW